MRSSLARYLGYALCVGAGLMIAIDVLPKAVVLLILAIGAVFIAATSRQQARSPHDRQR
jgi:uncharacterized membrane protein